MIFRPREKSLKKEKVKKLSFCIEKVIFERKIGGENDQVDKEFEKSMIFWNIMSKLSTKKRFYYHTDISLDMRLNSGEWR